MIRIVIAEDQLLVLGALAALLSLEPDIEVVAQVADGRAALLAVEELAPHVLVSDIEMPLMTGLDVASALQRMKSPTKVCIITTFGRLGYLRRALQAGVKGFMLKDTPADVLVSGIRKIASGGSAITPDLLESALDPLPDPLSNRERRVLRLASEGRSNKEIAALLSLSPGTVRNYLSEAASKLGARSRIEAAKIAYDNGWL